MLPFSDGSRSCIGMNLAYVDARTILLSILSKFWLELDPSVGSHAEVEAAQVGPMLSGMATTWPIQELLWEFIMYMHVAIVLRLHMGMWPCQKLKADCPHGWLKCAFSYLSAIAISMTARPECILCVNLGAAATYGLNLNNVDGPFFWLTLAASGLLPHSRPHQAALEEPCALLISAPCMVCWEVGHNPVNKHGKRARQHGHEVCHFRQLKLGSDEEMACVPMWQGTAKEGLPRALAN
eukprot:1160724-Pelagomonas_calceolata.AAC.3